MVRAPALVAAAALLLVGCGSSPAQPKPALTRAQQQGLQARLQKIRAAAGAGDLALTEERLRGFTREVARLRGAGGLDAPTALALATGASQAARRAGVEMAPPPTPAPAPAPVQKGRGKGHKGKGEGD